MIVISNASPLIALSRIDRLHLLKDLFADVYIPDADVIRQTPRRARPIEDRDN